MNISKEEAEQALRDVAASRLAMREVVRAHRGHLYLWLWGTVFIAIALLNWVFAEKYWVAGNWISAGGVVASFLIGWSQGHQIRSKVDRRFLAVCFALLAFGYGVWPVFLGAPHSVKASYGYSLLIWMQIYVVAGIWFRNYWLWIGLSVTALLLAGYVLFPGAFWAFSLVGGATLVGTGFYVRFCWR
jgi:predicted lysophospholipase L1 biosynthesis ABC-type transport system permease subunit